MHQTTRHCSLWIWPENLLFFYKLDPVQSYNLCIGRLHDELLWPAPVTMTTAIVLKTCTCWNKKGRRMLKLPMIGVTIVREYLKNIQSQNWYKGNATSHYTHTHSPIHIDHCSPDQKIINIRMLVSFLSSSLNFVFKTRLLGKKSLLLKHSSAFLKPCGKILSPLPLITCQLEDFQPIIVVIMRWKVKGWKQKGTFSFNFKFKKCLCKRLIYSCRKSKELTQHLTTTTTSSPAPLHFTDIHF